MPRIGLILSGCGVFDGSEIHEAVITMLCLDQQGAAYQCLAPNKPFDAVNHLTKQPAGQARNVLEESARIARGNVLDLADARGDEFDALIFPGGFGAAKNLCTFASEGSACSVDDHVRRVMTEAHHAGKPIGLVCIAPAVAARVFGESDHPTLTIGHDPGTASALEQMGAKHAPCDVTDFVVDHDNKIVTTPAYMEAKTIKDVYDGVNRMVSELLKMVHEPAAA